MKNKKSPIAEADMIVNKRSEERDREYGGFSAGLIKTAKIATELCGKEITPDDAFKILMSLKLSRLSHSPKFDSFVDLIGYTEGWWNYLEEKKLMDLQSCDGYPNCDCTGTCREAIEFGHPHSKLQPGEAGSNICNCMGGIQCDACKDADEAIKQANSIECDVCNGKGWFEGNNPHTRISCEQCGGTGRVPKSRAKAPFIDAEHNPSLPIEGCACDGCKEKRRVQTLEEDDEAPTATKPFVSLRKRSKKREQIPMKTALIRFNTKNDGKQGFWRVLFELDEEPWYKEQTYDKVKIMCASYTSQNDMPLVGLKFHITANYTTSFWIEESNTLILE